MQNKQQSAIEVKLYRKLGKMKKRILNLSMIYVLTLKTELRRFSMSWIIILPIQFLITFLISVQANLSGNDDDYASQILGQIYDQVFSDSISVFTMYLSSVLSIIIITCFFIFVLFKKSLSQLDKFSTILYKLVTISAILVCIFELLLINVLFNFKTQILNLLQGDTQYLYIYLFIVAFFGIFVVTVINYRMRMLGILSFFFYCISGTGTIISIVSAVIGMMLCFWEIKTDQQHDFLVFSGHNFRKIMHIILLVFFLWKIMDHGLIDKTVIYDCYISFIYLGVLQVAALVIGFIKFKCIINPVNPLFLQVAECRALLQENSTLVEPKVIVSDILVNNIKNLEKSSHIQLYELSKKNTKDWSIQDWDLILNTMVIEEKKKYSTLKSGINVLKCMMMRKNKQIYDIFQLLKEIIETHKTNNIRDLYQILKITLKIQNLHLKKHTNKYPVAHIVREVDKQTEDFYKNCCIIVDLINDFWMAVINYKQKLGEPIEDIHNQKDEEQQAMNKILISHIKKDMERLIVQIYQKIQKLDKKLLQISSISSTKREESALNCLKFLATSSKGGNEQIEQSDHRPVNLFSAVTVKVDDFSQYIQIIDSKITNVSFKLATELGYKKIQIIGEKSCFVMPQVYQISIQKAIRQHNEPVLRIPYLVPMICSDGSIILKHAQLYMQIDWQKGHRMVLHLTNTQYNKDPFIIYNTYRNTIEFYNKSFLDQFNIDKMKIDIKIRNSMLNPDQIFKEFQLSQKNVQIKLSESGLQTEYNCRINFQDICVRKSPKLQHARISMIEEQKGSMILKVMKGYRKSSTNIADHRSEAGSRQRLDSFANLSIIKSRDKKNNIQSQDNTNNTILCKIQNPYESKINFKKMQLSHPQKITLKAVSVIFIILAALMICLQSSIFLKIDADTDVALASQTKTALTSFKMYAQLTFAYQLNYKYILMVNQSAYMTSVGLKPAYWLADAATRIKKQLSEFQTEYLQSYTGTKKLKIPYSIQYTYFNISTYNNCTNLFDYSQNMLLYGNDQAAKFLVRNYRSFMNLSNNVIAYRRKVYLSFSDYSAPQYIAYGVIVSFAAILLVASTVINYKIGNVRNDVDKIFQLMDVDGLNQIFITLAHVKKSFLEFREKDNSNKKKKKKRLGMTQSLMKSQKSVHEMSERNLKQTQILQKFQTLDNEEAAETKTQEQTKKQLAKRKQKRNFYFGVWGYILTMSAFAIVIASQVVYFRYKIFYQSQITKFKLQNRMITYSFMRQVLEAQHAAMCEMYSITTNTYNQDSDVSIVNSQSLSASAFKDFEQVYFNKVSGNLCETVTNWTAVKFSYKQCILVVNGIMKYGEAKSIERINIVLEEVVSLGIQYWLKRDTGRYLPRAVEIFDTQGMVRQINTEVQQQLAVFQADFRWQMDLMSYLLFMMGIFLSLSLIAVLFVLKKQIYRSSQITVGYFLMLPNSILLQHDVLEHLRKNNILKRIGSI